MATVATIRPSAGNKFFPAKAHTAAPAVAGKNPDLDLIDKFHGRTRCNRQAPVLTNLSGQFSFCPFHFALCRYPFAFTSSSPSQRQKKSPKRGFSLASAPD
jgi:hypothetical protein